MAGSLPHGAIGMWGMGTIASQYQECDGSNGTRDLRDIFIRGAGLDLVPGSTGGQNSILATDITGAFDSPGHSLSMAELPPHSHYYGDLYEGVSGGGGSNGQGIVNRHPDTDGTGGADGLYGNGTSNPHYHLGGTVAFTGFLDENNTHHPGNLDNRPPYVVIKFVEVK